MKIAAFPQYSSIAGKPVFKAFIDSLHDHNINVVYDDMNADAAVIWSVLWNGRMSPNQQIWNHYRSLNKPVIVIEVGTLQRNRTWKISVNGIDRHAAWPTPDNKQRFDIPYKKWNKTGEFIVICGQHGKSELWKNMPEMNKWMITTSQKIRSISDKKIILRPHPRYPLVLDNLPENTTISYPNKIQNSYDDFDFDILLKNSYCVISHSGGTGVISILNGIPAFVSEKSMAYEVGNDISILNVNDLKYPKRKKWLRKLSYTEWTISEIRNGTVWKYISKLGCIYAL